MPTRHRWIAVTLLVCGALGLAAVAGLALKQHTNQLSYTAPAGHSQNTLTLLASGPTLELLDGATGSILASRPLAGTDGVTIQGAPGNVDDALTVDLSGGALALPDGIHFDGGVGGWDTLVVTGGDAAPGSYTATGLNSGIITHAGTRVFFSNLEPVTDTTIAANFTVLGTAGNNTINIVNGGSCGASCRTTQVNSPSFESISFANKTNVSVTGLAGADVFNLNNSLPATGLNKLVLDGGGNPGDAISIINFTLPASSGTLSLTNAITVTQSGAISVTNLAVHVAGPVNLGNFGNQVTNVAGNLTRSGASLFFASNVPTATVGSVEGVVGVTTQNGEALVEDPVSGHTLVVSNGINTGGGNLTLFADHMTFNGALNAGVGTVYLDNETFPEPILLGTKAANALGLLQTDLNRITAGVLQIGDFSTDTGGLTVTAPITAPAGWSTLDLRQNASIVASFGSGFSVPNLAARVHSGKVDIGFSTNHVGVLAGSTQGGAFDYIDQGHTSIGTVAGASGISTAGGEITVGTHSGGLAVNKAVMAGAGAIFLQSRESASTADDVVIGPGVVVSTTAGGIILWAGDHITLDPGSVVASSGAGNVLVAFSVEDTDNLGGATIAGTVASPGHVPQASGGDADETLLVDFQAGAALPDDLIYDGGGGQNNVTITDAGGSSPHLYEGGGTGISRDLASLIHFSRVQNVTAIGGSAPDQFGFRPDAGVVIHVIGGPPGSPPGDELFVNTLTTINPALTVTSFDATGETGQWTFSNRQPVDFAGIDSFFNLSHQVQLPLVQK